MADGDAFPAREELEDAAARLEALGRRVARGLRRWDDRDRRREARTLLRASYGPSQDLRGAAPGSTEARLALRRALDVERALARALGEDPLADVDVGSLLVTARPVRLAVEVLAPKSPVRLPWPLRYDLDRIYRIGASGRGAWDLATRFDEITDELEARAHRAADLLPEGDRPREPVVDMDDMELARSGRRPPVRKTATRRW